MFYREFNLTINVQIANDTILDFKASAIQLIDKNPWSKVSECRWAVWH